MFGWHIKNKFIFIFFNSSILIFPIICVVPSLTKNNLYLSNCPSLWTDSLLELFSWAEVEVELEVEAEVELEVDVDVAVNVEV